MPLASKPNHRDIDRASAHDERNTMRIKTTAGLLLAAGFTVAALTGCSGGQSVAEACSTAQSELSDVQTQLSSVQSDAASGSFSKVAESIGALEDRLDETADKLSNDEVKAAVEDLSDKIGEFGETFEGIDDGDTAALADRTEKMTDAATAVQDSGKKLDELCTA